MIMYSGDEDIRNCIKLYVNMTLINQPSHIQVPDKHNHKIMLQKTFRYSNDSDVPFMESLYSS